MDQQPDSAPEVPGTSGADMTRRQSMKVGAGILALAQCLGLPAALLAQDAVASLELKYYRTTGGTTRLVYAEPLASPVMEMLMGGGVAELELKWYYGSEGLLGGTRLPAEVQQKLERVRASVSKLERS